MEEGNEVLIPENEAHLEKLVKKFSTLYGTQRLITIFKTAYQRSLS
jgi:hypothetical protein